MAFHRASQAFIDLKAYRSNFQSVRSLLPQTVDILAVVKADAYGHGAVPCARAAIEAGAHCLGVAIVNEGIELREHGLSSPILVMGSFLPDDAEDMVRHDLEITLHTLAQADAVENAARKQNKLARVHIKIDSGMGRLGIECGQAQSLFQRVTGSKSLKLSGLFTHLATAEWEDKDYARYQLGQFETLIQSFREQYPQLPPVHCANSAATVNHSKSWFDMVRPGLIFYGAFSAPNLLPMVRELTRKEDPIRPVMTWKCKILQIKSMPRDACLSYGITYKTARDSRIAVIGVGYADGIHRLLSNKMEVLIQGRRARQVGRVCMDMTLIDVTDLPKVVEGDEVVIFGRQGDAAIPVEETAAHCQSVAYELLCAVGQRVPRVYNA